MAKYVRAEIILAERVLFDREQIQSGIERVSDQVVAHYGTPEGILAVCVLKGGVAVTVALLADLYRRYGWDIPVEYMTASSAPNGANGRTMPILSNFNQIPPGKHILLVDDIADTGYTLDEIYRLLTNRGAESVNAAALLKKHECQEVEFSGQLFWALAVVGSPWVSGFGIDQDGVIGRNDDRIMVKE